MSGRSAHSDVSQIPVRPGRCSLSHSHVKPLASTAYPVKLACDNDAVVLPFSGEQVDANELGVDVALTS